MNVCILFRVIFQNNMQSNKLFCKKPNIFAKSFIFMHTLYAFVHNY